MSILEQMQLGQGSITEQVTEQAKRKGVFLAKVTNITDPDKLNRIKCKLVTIDPDVLETDWCYVMAPLGGASCGLHFIPSLEDYVILTYLNGEEQRPIVLGSCWNATCTAPYVIEDGKNFNYSMKTPKGSELLFYDEGGKEKITLKTPTGATLLIDDENKAAKLSDPDGKNSLSMDWNKGEVTLKADKKISLVVGANSLVIDSTGSITVKSDKEISLQSVTVTGKADNKVALSGAMVEAKATGQLTLEASGVANLKGAMVNIN